LSGDAVNITNSLGLYNLMYHNNCKQQPPRGFRWREQWWLSRLEDIFVAGSLDATEQQHRYGSNDYLTPNCGQDRSFHEQRRCPGLLLRNSKATTGGTVSKRTKCHGECTLGGSGEVPFPSGHFIIPRQKRWRHPSLLGGNCPMRIPVRGVPAGRLTAAMTGWVGDGKGCHFWQPGLRAP
jgi:hypothetical protein